MELKREIYYEVPFGEQKGYRYLLQQYQMISYPELDCENGNFPYMLFIDNFCLSFETKEYALAVRAELYELILLHCFGMSGND